jgi:transcriptional antiterminator RfaH
VGKQKLFETREMGLAMAELQAMYGLEVQSDALWNEQSRCWLAAYTRSHHESAVTDQLQHKALATLLPTYERLSRWSDRVRRTRAPLFPGYVFVCVNESERVRVLQTAGVVSIVSRAGKPVPLSDEEIRRLRLCAESPCAEPHPFLQVGKRVRVKHGLFQGLEGILVEKKNSSRLVISIEQIMRSVSIDLHGADVDALN